MKDIIILRGEHEFERLTRADDNYTFSLKDNVFLSLLVGIDYSPENIDWSFYFEFYYNGDGYTSDEWKDFSNNINAINNMTGPGLSQKYGLLGNCNNNFNVGYMSNIYCLLHARSNDYILDLISIEDTIITAFPFGLFNIFKTDFELVKDKLYLNLEFFNLVYAVDDSELYYHPYRFYFEMSLNYNLSF